MKFSDCKQYKGTWCNDQMTGFGLINFKEMTLEGEFLDGLLHG